MIAILSSLIGVYYYFKVIYAMFKEDGAEKSVLSPNHVILLVVAGLLSLGIGLFPAWVQTLLA
jgi:NADH-quinone oxidoreductase subunit N